MFWSRSWDLICPVEPSNSENTEAETYILEQKYNSKTLALHSKKAEDTGPMFKNKHFFLAFQGLTPKRVAHKARVLCSTAPANAQAAFPWLMPSHSTAQWLWAACTPALLLHHLGNTESVHSTPQHSLQQPTPLFTFVLKTRAVLLRRKDPRANHLSVHHQQKSEGHDLEQQWKKVRDCTFSLFGHFCSSTAKALNMLLLSAYSNWVTKTHFETDRNSR